MNAITGTAIILFVSAVCVCVCVCVCVYDYYYANDKINN